MHSKYDEIQEVLENYKKQLQKPKADWPHDVRRAMAFIIDHLFDPRLTVGWMRQRCRINGKSLTTQFALFTGFTPKQYILHHRIETGKLLLKQTEATVTQIALAVGFGSLSAFCKIFKVKEGLRPSQWRGKA